MAKAKKKFGLDDMFPVSDSVTSTALSNAFPEVEEAVQSIVQDIGRTYGDIPIESITPNPYQPRKSFDQQKLQELADSLSEDGMLSPILVRVSSRPGMYEMAAGERRWRAAKLAGWTAVPAEILEACSDAKMKRIALLENIQREQLTPLELAEIYEALLQERDEGGKPVYTVRSLAEMLKKNKDHVDEHRALLRVPQDARQLIEEDPDIPVRVIRELGNVEDQADRTYLIEEVRARNLKTADVIAILQQRRRIQQKPTASHPSAESSASIVLPTGQAAGTFPAQETTRTSTSLPVQETATVVEHERRASKPSPALALVVLERKLHKDQTQLQKALGWIMSEVPAMNSEEKALVRTYVQQWCQLFQQASEEI
ncbi:MAG TPA: ParB/RepB/Spo0J family partition protein [Ktedonobacteraceae bacterium]|nr:ParB/RepB/Spo0J family partition protein [Ktedonobacteraceae bacterium]